MNSEITMKEENLIREYILNNNGKYLKMNKYDPKYSENVCKDVLKYFIDED